VDESAITDGTFGVKARATDSARVQTTKRGLARLAMMLFVRFISGSQCPISSEGGVPAADHGRDHQRAAAGHRVGGGPFLEIESERTPRVLHLLSI
jgi:hypothetical protein